MVRARGTRVRLKLGLLAGLAAVLPLFQNCTPASMSSNLPVAQNSSGNGDGYSGKLTVYDRFDSAAPCANRNAANLALPNDVILVPASGGAQLVRENCQDIDPKGLAMSELIFDGGRLRYGQKDFFAHVPVTFETVVASCPAGSSQINDQARQNLFDSPLDLSSQAWGTLEGMATHLDSAIAGLPASRLTRTQDASAKPYLRTDQFVLLSADTRYSLSFLVKRGTSSSLRLEMYDNRPVVTDALLVWDLMTGLATQSSGGRLASLSSTSRAYEGGWFVTVHFKTPATIFGLDIGLAPATYAPADSVLVSEAQLEKTDNFCTP